MMAAGRKRRDGIAAGPVPVLAAFKNAGVVRKLVARCSEVSSLIIDHQITDDQSLSYFIHWNFFCSWRRNL